jgi:murein DD-endopeptidase MepM/ murein hydrolase activator NlpD
MRFIIVTSFLLAIGAVLVGCGGGGGGGSSVPGSGSLGQGLFFPTSRVWADGKSQSDWPYSVTDPRQPPNDPGNIYGYMQPGYPAAGLEHVATDIRTSLNQKIRAVCDGVIEDYINASNPYDRAIFVKHRLPDGTVFHAVYGHQTLKSGLAIGESVTGGQQIGYSADPDNTHLHFGINRNSIPRDAWGRIETGKNPADYGWVPPRSWLMSHAK